MASPQHAQELKTAHLSSTLSAATATVLQIVQMKTQAVSCMHVGRCGAVASGFKTADRNRRKSKLIMNTNKTSTWTHNRPAILSKAFA